MTATLLGKSVSGGRPPKTLLQHTLDVAGAAESLFGAADAPTRLGGAWLRFFRLTAGGDWPRFYWALTAACLFHDWGKANEGMQAILRRDALPKGQSFRHEHLSVLLMGFDGVRGWTAQRTDIDWSVVVAAVGSHHLKFSHDEFAAETTTGPVRMHLNYPDFLGGLVGATATRLKLGGEPRLPKQSYWGYLDEASTTFHIGELRERLQRELHKSFRESTPLLSAVRAALIAADAVGSGLPRTGQGIDSWIDARFDPAKLCDAAAVDGIINGRVAELTARGKPFGWNQFQLDSETLPSRALLLAPCGSGKTLAAWKWIRGQVAERPVGRVIFLYPTRATATEGFKDYISHAPEDDAGLLHGTAGYDLDGMFDQSDPRGKSNYDATDPRLFALRHWSKRVFSATADQFFAFMAYSYGPACLLPLLADSVIVVDEVHSFDRAMFSALLGFLNHFDVPVLCMTATLLDGRKEQLRPLVGRVYEDRPGELAAIAGAPRYELARLDAAEIVAKVRQSVAEGKRVLWVVNQVSRAQAAVGLLAGIGCEVICYHSRFKLDDRVDRHRETVAAIRPGQPAAVVVSTQVCEMSLDIDADVLITEECPISSLVQRMGRCRRGREELACKGPGEVFVCKPDEERVYSKDDLAGLAAFLDFVCAKQPAASQSDLEDGLRQFGPKGADAPKLNSFLASGAFADAGEDSYRDIEEFNVRAVLGTDVAAYLKGGTGADGLIVPVPRKLRPRRDTPGLPKWLHVADARHYDPRTGYHDEPVN